MAVLPQQIDPIPFYSVFVGATAGRSGKENLISTGFRCQNVYYICIKNTLYLKFVTVSELQLRKIVFIR
jgi:hypothetical protein